MSRRDRKSRRPWGAIIGFLIALALSTATIIFTGLRVTALSRGDVAEEPEPAAGVADPGSSESGEREPSAAPDAP